MPLSKYEEQGVNSHAWHSSDSVAGIPIKKRRFLLVRPASPPPEIPSSPQLESHKEQFIAKPVSSSPNAGGPRELSGFAGGTESSLSEKREEHSGSKNVNLVQNTAGYSDLGRHDQTLSTVFGSEVDSKCKLFPGNTELQLASYGNLAPVIGEKMNNKLELSLSGPSGKSELSRIPGNSELLFAPKVSLHMASSGENSEGTSKDQEKLDPHKWNLGLPKGQNCSNDGELEINGTSRANRSHWDLNTKMETWGDSVNDAASSPRTGGVDVPDSVGIHDIKPVIGSTEKVVSKREGTHIGLGQKLLNKSDQFSKPRPDDLLHLGLRPLVPQSGLSQDVSCFPREVDSRPVISNLSLTEKLVSPSKLVDRRVVKSEPSNEGNRLEPVAKVAPPKLVVGGIVKSEPLQGCSDESQKLSNTALMKSVDQGAVKSEPVQGSSEENLKRAGKMSMQLGIHTNNFGVSTSPAVPTRDSGIPVTKEMLHPPDLPTTGLSNSGTVDHSLLPTMQKIPVCGEGGQEVSNSVGFVATGLVSQLVSPDRKEPKSADYLPDLPSNECLNVANPVQSSLSAMDELHVDSPGNGEVSESDEKVNISADEEFSCDSDEESDGNHAVGDLMDTENKPNCKEVGDYEDGEVREPSVHSATEDVLCTEGDAEHVDDKSISVSAFTGEEPSTSDVQDRDTKMEETEHSECTEQHENIVLDKKDEQGHNEVARVQETSPVPLPSSETEKKPIEDVKQLDPTEREHEKCNIAVLASDGVISAGEVPATSDGKDEAVRLQEDANRTNSLGSSCSDLSKAEPCVNSGEETAKDVNGKGNRSRIINLPRASNVSLSGATKPAQGRVLASQSQGERFSDIALRGDKLHARGSREGRYLDPKFERRNRDQPFGSTGSEFRLGRGRVDNQLRSMRGKWDSNHDFSTEQSNGPIGFRFSRSKNAAVSAKVECSDFVAARGGRTLGTGRGRGGRKPLSGELPNFRHPLSRRRSPGGREGHASRGVQIVRRAPRDISPDRCITEDDPDLIGLRHEEKFMRVLPGEGMNTVFPRAQPQFERMDDSFVRGERSFSPLQRRVPLHIPQVNSKSPPQPRRRSPGPWLSPKRTPDGFFGHQEMERMRSPQTYRNGRMRSPHQLPCFAEEMVVRRHDSPPYMPRICNDMRDIGSSREHDHPRSFIRGRSPSGRILPRSTRRFEMVDPRERNESEDLFAEAVHSGRFHDIVGDGGDDGRRKCIERRGPVRSFCPPYDGSDVVNFHHHGEDGPRPYRFCPEDAEFHERGNSRGRGFGRGSLRGRGFDRRMKNRPDAPRTRIIEEQEENYWHAEQDWHDADFEDASHMKRRRF